ncbi:MAG: COG4223 family protein [Planktomarina sp.]
MARKTTSAGKTAKAKKAVKDVAEIIEDAEVVVEKTEPPVEVSEPEVVAEAEVTPEPAPQPAQKRGFVPMVLGGLIAGGIGFGAATYLPQFMGPSDDPLAAVTMVQDETASQIQALTAQVNEVAGRTVPVDTSADLANLMTRVGALDQHISDMGGSLADLTNRIVALEKQPLNDSVSPAAIGAYERDLEILREAINLQRTQIEKVAADAAAQIQAAKAEAQAMETQAAVLSQNGVARAAIGRVQASLENGSVYVSALDDLRVATDVTVPTILAENASIGIANLSQLQSDFSDLASVALQTARAVTGPAEGESALGSFLKSQLGVRSLTPQSGNSPDAVLSRAEAAVNAGRLNDALAELSALPAEAQNELNVWTTQAQTRLDAVSAANDLAAAIAAN